MSYTGDLGSAGDSWANDLFNSPNVSTLPTSEGVGVFSGAIDSLGGIIDTAGNWFGKYLNYQQQKDIAKFKLQAAQQQALLNTVERNQQTGYTPLNIKAGLGVPAPGLDNNAMLLIAIAAGVTLVTLFNK
jgi:hypothetical protein